MKSQEEKIRRMLYEVGRRMIEAIGRSNEVEGAVQRIHDEGYSLYLVLDGAHDVQAQLELRAADKPRSEPSPAALPAASIPPPSFRLNSDDVTFLKSLGIDATRSPRRRSSSS